MRKATIAAALAVATTAHAGTEETPQQDSVQEIVDFATNLRKGRSSKQPRCTRSHPIKVALVSSRTDYLYEIEVRCWKKKPQILRIDREPGFTRPGEPASWISKSINGSTTMGDTPALIDELAEIIRGMDDPPVRRTYSRDL